MFRPTFERLENREVFATFLGISPMPELLPAVVPLPMENISVNLASPVAATADGQVAGVATGDVNSDNLDFLHAQILPYIEQDNLYKQVNSARGDREFVTRLSEELLVRSSDSPHDAALNQLGLASDGRFSDLNRPQGIIAILIG